MTPQESGLAREYITDEYLLPSPNLRKWTTCNVVKEGKTVFRMYLDDAQTRFMLSAKRVGDAFYISQYETFPEVRVRPIPWPLVVHADTHVLCVYVCLGPSTD